MSRKSEEILPLAQFLERSPDGCVLHLTPGALLAHSGFPDARGLQQQSPAVEPRFRYSKELVNTTIFYFCFAAHDYSPVAWIAFI
jgi:hypothetical protein